MAGGKEQIHEGGLLLGLCSGLTQVWNNQPVTLHLPKCLSQGWTHNLNRIQQMYQVSTGVARRKHCTSPKCLNLKAGSLESGIEVDSYNHEERKTSFEHGPYPGEARMKRCRNGNEAHFEPGQSM